MFLKPGHTQLIVFQEIKKMTSKCCKKTRHFPTDKKFAVIFQTRRAALSVHLSLKEGASGKSINERKCYFEISRV